MSLKWRGAVRDGGGARNDLQNDGGQGPCCVAGKKRLPATRETFGVFTAFEKRPCGTDEWRRAGAERRQRMRRDRRV